MSVIVAIHQPNFLPWLGFFDKIARSDRFVLLDQVQFIRRSWISRVAIREDGVSRWISVPVVHEGRQEVPIDRVCIDGSSWHPERVQERLRHAYHRAPHWKTHALPVVDMLSEPHDRLLDLNLALLKRILDRLGLDGSHVVLQSSLGGEGQKSALMASLTRAAGGTTYLSGGHPPEPGAETAGTAADYNDPDVYAAHGVTLEYQAFSHPVHSQGGEGFLPGLSVLDALAHLGPAAGEGLGER